MANTQLDAHDLAHGALAEATPTTRTNTPPTRQTHTLITRFRHFEDTIQQFATHLTTDKQ